MPGTISAAKVDIQISATEQIDTANAGVAANNRTFAVGAFGLRTSLTPSTTAQGEQQGVGEHVCNGSSQSLDFTAIPHVNGTIVNASGKKLVAFTLTNPSSNTGVITINDHATNGYKLFGDRGTGNPRGVCTLRPGETTGKGYVATKANGNAVVSGTAKIVEILGTNAEKLQYHFVFGD